MSPCCNKGREPPQRVTGAAARQPGPRAGAQLALEELDLTPAQVPSEPPAAEPCPTLALGHSLLGDRK